MAKPLSAIDREKAIEESRGVVEAQKQVRITLSTDWHRVVELNWNPGGRNGRNSIVYLRPGQSVVQPIDKAQAWFGPFALYEEYETCTDESRKVRLREAIAIETARYLLRYDYPRGVRGYQPNMQPTGPHRSPDVTVTVIEPDGSEHEPIRLHELYEIGEFDPIKDSFAPQESFEEIKTRYEQKLEERDRAIDQLKENQRELAGMLKGYIAGKNSDG